MNLEPAPRLSKSTFLLIDAGLLLTAFLIAYFAKDPFAPLPFITAVLFVGAAGVVGLIPFLIDYAADSAEYVQAERARVAEQVQRLQAASESLARAAAQIKAVEEAVHKTAHAAENLPYRMQEKLAEFNSQLAQSEDEEKERMTEELATHRQAESERLQTIADKIHKATTELAALEAAARKQLAAAQDAAAGKFEARLNAALTALDTKLAGIEVSAPRAAAPVEEKKPELQPAPPIVESVSVTESAAPAETTAALEEAKPKKPRAPRKPKPEESALAANGTPGDGEPAFPDTPSESAAPLAAQESAPAESSVSSDGATRLLATAYIGIGNKLFIRGDGPGLSWDKGVPMQFVSIGKWGWASHDVTAPVACKLYKNDETAALSGEISLAPGKHVEVTALF